MKYCTVSVHLSIQCYLPPLPPAPPPLPGTARETTEICIMTDECYAVCVSSGGGTILLRFIPPPTHPRTCAVSQHKLPPGAAIVFGRHDTAPFLFDGLIFIYLYIFNLPAGFRTSCSVDLQWNWFRGPASC